MYSYKAVEQWLTKNNLIQEWTLYSVDKAHAALVEGLGRQKRSC